ncbi:hypothetical protein Pint_31878 [Pistacia integerrima]|uniref:Uncharacterized protein n=1 Tax=Pistacia integerrima TaxID=434235 RepID=A0ACC0XPH0_9ROSI|nr:hypothetical protein Pint_31878 [Pistacia integerrima]
MEHEAKLKHLAEQNKRFAQTFPEKVTEGVCDVYLDHGADDLELHEPIKPLTPRSIHVSLCYIIFFCAAASPSSLQTSPATTPSIMAPKKDKAPPPSSKPAKSGGGKQKKKKWSKGKQKEKVNNMVLFDQATYDKLLSEVPKYKLVTPSILSDRLRVRT